MSDQNNASSNKPRQDATAATGSLLAYLQLFRLPNVFTAIADVVAGYLLVHPSLLPVPAFALLVLSSCLLYSAGMVLNDVYDLEVDRKERPGRPLPSGRVDVAWARILGYGMLVSGIAAASLTGLPMVGDSHFPWRPAAVSIVLAACILLYDAVLKKTLAGPLLMGACRFFNILLGASTAVAAGGGPARLGYDMPELTVAGGMGIYIVGVTLLARTEAVQSQRASLTTATMIIVFGMATLATFPNQFTEDLLRELGKPSLTLPSSYWLLLVGLMVLNIVRPCIQAISDPSPRNVQLAVKNCILWLIALNAAIVLQVGGISYALGVFALVAPALLLGKWVYST